MERAVTLLPEPDSPTTARVSRAWISKEMPLTIWVQPPGVRKASVCYAFQPEQAACPLAEGEMIAFDRGNQKSHRSVRPS